MEFLRWKLDQPGVVIDADAIEKSVEKPAPYFPFRFSLGKGSVMHFYGVRYEDGRLMFDRYLLLLGRGAGKTDISVMIVFIC